MANNEDHQKQFRCLAFGSTRKIGEYTYSMSYGYVTTMWKLIQQLILCSRWANYPIVEVQSGQPNLRPSFSSWWSQCYLSCHNMVVSNIILICYFASISLIWTSAKILMTSKVCLTFKTFLLYHKYVKISWLNLRDIF